MVGPSNPTVLHWDPQNEYTRSSHCLNISCIAVSYHQIANFTWLGGVYCCDWWVVLIVRVYRRPWFSLEFMCIFSTDNRHHNTQSSYVLLSVWNQFLLGHRLCISVVQFVKSINSQIWHSVPASFTCCYIATFVWCATFWALTDFAENLYTSALLSTLERQQIILYAL